MQKVESKVVSITSLLTHTVAHSTRISLRRAQNQQPAHYKEFKSCCQLSKSHQKFDIVLENKVVKKFKLSKSINNKKCTPKMIFLNEGQVSKQDSPNVGKICSKYRFLFIYSNSK